MNWQLLFLVAMSLLLGLAMGYRIGYRAWRAEHPVRDREDTNGHPTT